jgi:pseudouridine-5'-phosphate glycosidase
MVAARAAGISVFVTGGIGGVHRGAEKTMDVSADLIELGRTNVAVVCAGVKSILDIPKTLEVLETQGTAVATLGSKEFPAFFTSKSGCESPMTVDSPRECAQIIDAQKKLGLTSGILFAVPIPAKEEADAAVVSKAIQQALAESDEQGILGRDVTPFLLKRVNELTKGASLKSSNFFLLLFELFLMYV